MGVLKEESLGILVDAINRNVNTKINAIKGGNNATDVTMQDGTSVEVAVNKNKNDINDINTYLNKSENTKYQTLNGVKEFESKDGYVDNVLLDGKTLINLFNGRAFFTVDCELDAPKKLTNTQVTLFNFSDKQINYITSTKEGTLTVRRTITVNPRKSVLETISEGEYLWTAKGYTASGWSESLLSDFNNSVCAIQGDYTNAPISYFDGLKSVGQGDKIEIITRNSDSSKENKKQILVTLRSLPNGVKDTVEKRGNKYYKIQRCGEVTLNGSEGWSSDSSKWNSTTVKPFVANAIPDAKVDGNNLNICYTF